MFLTTTKSVRAIQDDGTAQPSFAQTTCPSVLELVKAQKRKSEQSYGDRPPKHSRADLSRRGEDGLYSHNRAGSEVCRLFNEDRCSLPCPSCPNKRMHQCSKCWQTGHASAAAEDGGSAEN
eukprot:4831356-Amphidinium_carterae.1